MHCRVTNDTDRYVCVRPAAGSVVEVKQGEAHEFPVSLDQEPLLEIEIRPDDIGHRSWWPEGIRVRFGWQEGDGSWHWTP